jgi:three-Cys-motif partner protein
VAPSSDVHPEYWVEYSNLQRIKHDLIRCYLGGWFAKLGSWSGRVLYFDTHAGRGKHISGQHGSPLVALTTLLNHQAKERLLKNSAFSFFLIEKDKENLDLLAKEIESFGELPKGVEVFPVSGDYSHLLDEVLACPPNAQQN